MAPVLMEPRCLLFFGMSSALQHAFANTDHQADLSKPRRKCYYFPDNDDVVTIVMY
jgi:hypothetical protein